MAIDLRKPKQLVAVVDDEPDILELVSHHLQKADFKVASLRTAQDLLKFIQDKTPDLIVLDLMLPDADGLEICKHLKGEEALEQIPIVILTAKGEEPDRIVGLELGADDYVVKPFSPRELVARIKAVLRRFRPKEIKKITIGKTISIDPDKFEVRVEGKNANLTATEFRLLKLLASRKGWVFSRTTILNHLWGQEKAVLDRTVDVHIKNLRSKLGPAEKMIRNVRGIGYKLEL